MGGRNSAVMPAGSLAPVDDSTLGIADREAIAGSATSGAADCRQAHPPDPALQQSSVGCAGDAGTSVAECAQCAGAVPLPAAAMPAHGPRPTLSARAQTSQDRRARDMLLRLLSAR